MCALKMVVPKGRIQTNVVELLRECDVELYGTDRSYRPTTNDERLEVKLLKCQNIPPLVAMGQHDVGFAGADWIREQDADVETVLDLGFDPVRIVACIPDSWSWDTLRQRPLIVASEYRRLTTEFLARHDVTHTFVAAHGATEVFPPEDADMIVDNTSTGATIRANRLKIVDTVMESTTRMIANRAALDDPAKRDVIDQLVLLMEGVLTARGRVLLEMNCGPEQLDRIVALLPAMKSPTISKLHYESGFALRAAVPRSAVRELLPRLRRAGATDILETPIRKVIA